MTWDSTIYFLLLSCSLSNDIYFEEQTSAFLRCIKHSFNNCVQRDLMSCEDWQKYIGDYRMKDHDEPVFVKGLVQYVNQSHAGITAHIQPIEGTPVFLSDWAEALTKEVFHPDFQCLLFSGKYYETVERAHFTTLTKVITADGAYELWYLDSQRPPTSIAIGSKGKIFQPPHDYAPVSMDSFKFQPPAGSTPALVRDAFMNNVYEFLLYFIADYHLPRAHNHQPAIFEIEKIYSSAPRSAMEVVQKEEVHGEISTMEVATERKALDAKRDVVAAEQQYLDLLLDYEHDIAAEEMREKRAVLRLFHEKQKVFRAKKEFDKVERKTRYRY